MAARTQHVVVCLTGLTVKFISSQQLQLRHRSETSTMKRRRPVFAQGCKVLWRAVACVTLPTVMGMIKRGLPHDPVTMLLGDD